LRWMYNGHTAQWEAAFGGWRAVVQSLSTQCTWQAAITRRYPPYHKYEQTDFEWPRGAMTWCEEEIMRQRWRVVSALGSGG
jgi:hypothetical protein